MPTENKITAIEKAIWQPKLFASSPRRSELLGLKPGWRCRSIAVRVHRNMPFEFVAGVLRPFLAYAELEADIHLSAYDDSLAFASVDGHVDCELVWLDYRRYDGRLDPEKLLAWLTERLQALRAISDAPILIADGGGLDPIVNEKLAKALAAIPGLRIFPRQALEQKLGARWVDTRMQNAAAHSMSDEAVIATAQLLGLVWLPAAVNTALKAIILDLDHTLYDGVLGEDGIDGIQLTPAHRAFQEKLLALKERGIFLGLLSRNEPEDVQKLFASRKDMPLQWEDFSATSIGWKCKSQGLHEIAAQLKIHSDAMLVIDDNLGEIAEIASLHPTTAFWHASDPALTAAALDLFPRLLRWHDNEADRLRIDDLKAAQQRSALAAQIDPADYLRSLDVALEFCLDPHEMRDRLTELSNKTNQFALSLARFNEAEVARRLNDENCATFAVSLSDKLSDSGVIAAIFCQMEGTTLMVDEICISCRALGRHIETVMIVTALAQAQEKFGADDIAFVYSHGPRNEPARQWLKNSSGKELAELRGHIIVAWENLRNKMPDLPVRIIWQPVEKAA